jgi:16S rRNA U516 pseudouridylate synthase RsuA-like enzyme
MKKNRQELEHVIQNFIQNYTESKRKLRDSLITELSNYGINPGKTQGLVNLSIPLVTIGNAELYLLTKSLYNSTNEQSLEPTKWFNEEEEKNYTLYKEKVEYNNDVIILNNVDQVSEKQWVCTKATYQEISKIISQGLITYNVRTQRETTSIVFNNDNIIKVPTIKQKPIQEMTKLMLNGKFTPNTITWNIRRTGEEMLPEYDEKNRSIAIPVDNIKSFCDQIDGQHRTSSFIKAVEQNPDIEGYTMISILYYSEEEAQEYIDQEAHHTPISLTHRESFRNSDTEVIIAKEINKFGNENNNILFNKFATIYDDIKHDNKYLTFETFSKALKHNFSIENPREVTKTSKFLREYFNNVLVNLDENGILYTNNTFIGLIAIAGKLYSHKEWQSILEENISNIATAINTLTESDINNKKLTSPFIKKMSDKFIEVVTFNV